MATKITFDRFAGLASGRIATIHSNCPARATLEFFRKGDTRLFVMERYRHGTKETHTLAYDATTPERLQAHWDGFCA